MGTFDQLLMTKLHQRPLLACTHVIATDIRLLCVSSRCDCGDPGSYLRHVRLALESSTLVHLFSLDIDLTFTSFSIKVCYTTCVCVECFHPPSDKIAHFRLFTFALSTILLHLLTCSSLNRVRNGRLIRFFFANSVFSFSPILSPRFLFILFFFIIALAQRLRSQRRHTHTHTHQAATRTLTGKISTTASVFSVEISAPNNPCQGKQPLTRFFLRVDMKSI